tara:strand:+ start:2001 stop:2660 length:660 start_codon:yes stop_codon:yes gene_type:complete
MIDKDIIISASILSSDFRNLEKEIKALNFSGIDEFHLDIMDGHFVENISFGQPIVQTVRNLTNLPIEVHLMVDNPMKYIDSFLEIGVNIFTFHIESVSNPTKLISRIKESDSDVGIAINPDSEISQITPFLDDIDRVLFMTVYPGKGGQSYLKFVNEKIKSFISDFSSKNIIVGVDGGIKSETIKEPYNCGARMFVSGTGILNNDLGYLGAVNDLRKST